MASWLRNKKLFLQSLNVADVVLQEKLQERAASKNVTLSSVSHLLKILHLHFPSLPLDA